MAKKSPHVSETPATQWLRAAGVPFTEHVYDYVGKRSIDRVFRRRG